MPSRSTGNHTGSPISPRSPLVNHTRLLTLPGSTATTSTDAGTAWRNNSTISHLLTNRKGPPCSGKSLTLKAAQELSAVPILRLLCRGRPMTLESPYIFSRTDKLVQPPGTTNTPKQESVGRRVSRPCGNCPRVPKGGVPRERRAACHSRTLAELGIYRTKWSNRRRPEDAGSGDAAGGADPGVACSRRDLLSATEPAVG